MSEEELVAKLRRKVARATIAMHPVGKNTTANLGEKRGSYNYANIEAVLETVKAALQEEGVSVQQPFTIHTTEPPVLTVDTVLTDSETGMYLMYTGPGFPVKGDPQAAGGAITYFRRYSLVSLFGLVVEDDDGAQSHRQAVAPQHRTEAESMIREGLGKMDDAQKTEFALAFKEEFGATLSALPEGKHGDALSFYKFYTENQTTEGA